jgi:hypothetical protein
MIQSLWDQGGPAPVWVLALDDACEKFLRELAWCGLRVVSLATVEQEVPALLRAKAERSMIEYYWTLTPFLPAQVLAWEPTLDRVAYLDADLFFTGPVSLILDEWGSGDLFIVPHRNQGIDDPFRDYPAGRFNVGFVGFKRGPEAGRCLARWGQQCLEWCYATPQPGRLGDQKYLDDWPRVFSGVVISSSRGIGVGGWNVTRYSLDTRKDGFYVSGHQLLMCHFNFVHFVGRNWLMGCPRWRLQPLYRLYGRYLEAALTLVIERTPNYQPRLVRRSLLDLLAGAPRGALIRLSSPVVSRRNYALAKACSAATGQAGADILRTEAPLCARDSWSVPDDDDPGQTRPTMIDTHPIAKDLTR